MKDDLVIIEFEGTPVPTSARLRFVSQHRDEELHRVCLERHDLLAGHTTAQMDFGELAKITDFVEAAMLESETRGGPLVARGRGNPIGPGPRRSPADVEANSVEQSRVGRMGEEIANQYFQSLLDQEILIEVTWIADLHANAPYDFILVWRETNEREFVDVKTTSGPHDNPVYLSYAELVCASAARREGSGYRVFRISELSMASKGMFLEGTSELAETILSIIDATPDGVRPLGFQVSVDLFDNNGRLIDLSAFGNEE